MLHASPAAPPALVAAGDPKAAGLALALDINRSFVGPTAWALSLHCIAVLQSLLDLHRWAAAILPQEECVTPSAVCAGRSVCPAGAGSKVVITIGPSVSLPAV